MDGNVFRMMLEVKRTLQLYKNRLSNWALLCLFCCICCLAATINSCAANARTDDNVLKVAKLLEQAVVQMKANAK